MRAGRDGSREVAVHRWAKAGRRASGVRRHLARTAFACAAVLAAGCGNESVTLFGTPQDAPRTISLTATAEGATGAVLSWTAPAADYAYRVDRNGKVVADTRDTRHVESGLAAGERYCWTVYARSGFGWQARSDEACLGTTPSSKEWRIETVASGRWPAIAVSASGELHLCFAATAGAGLSYLRVGPGREPEIVDANGQAQCSIAVDAAGIVHIAYLSRFGLRHARLEPGGTRGWQATTVDAQALVGVRRFDGPALALGADGAPRIAYRRPTSNGLASISVATREADGWRIESTGIAGLVGPRSLAVDPSGRSRLATTDELGQSVTAWRRDARSWSAEFSDSLAPTAGDGPPIVLDPGGAARTAWWHRSAPTASTTLELRWSQSTPSGWRTESIETVRGLGTRVAIGSAGDTPRIAAVDPTGAVRIHTRGADRWTAESIDGQGGAADAVDFVVGPDGQLRVVFDLAAEARVRLASRAP